MGGHPLSRGLAALAPLVLLPALAACSGDTPSASPGETGGPATAAPSASPTPSGPLFARADGTGPREGSGGAEGSGCEPETSLPSDGVWFGLSDGTSTGGVGFDLACLYVGAEAEAQAAAAGEEAFDFYIANDDPDLVALSWAPDAKAYRMDDPSAPVSVADFVADPFGPTYSPGWSPVAVWVWINDGLVTEIEAVYFP